MHFHNLYYLQLPLFYDIYILFFNSSINIFLLETDSSKHNLEAASFFVSSLFSSNKFIIFFNILPIISLSVSKNIFFSQICI